MAAFKAFEGIGRRRIRAVSLGAAGLALVLATAACGSSGSSGTTSGTTAPAASSAAAAGGHKIVVKDFMFTPMSMTVSVGTTVTWQFEDSTAHTVKADDGSFSSSALSNGGTYSYTFTKAGTFSYICSIHPSMKGTITVQ